MNQISKNFKYDLTQSGIILKVWNVKNIGMNWRGIRCKVVYHGTDGMLTIETEGKTYHVHHSAVLFQVMDDSEIKNDVDLISGTITSMEKKKKKKKKRIIE